MPRKGRKPKVAIEKDKAAEAAEDAEVTADAFSLVPVEDSGESHTSETINGGSPTSADDPDLPSSPSADDLLGDGAMGEFLSKAMKDNPQLTLKQILQKLKVAKSTFKTYQIQWIKYSRYILIERAKKVFTNTNLTDHALVEEFRKLVGEVCVWVCCAQFML